MAGEGKHVVIVGGGSAGITVAASLVRRAAGTKLDITLVEPSENHYYQPAFTLVGAGAYKFDSTRRPEAKLIPRGVEWIREKSTGFDPAQNRISLSSGSTLAYDYLVVCPGLELNWEKIAGAKETLGQNGVCSNYDPAYTADTWSCLQNLGSGATAVFTQAPLPFKCPGAPQKIAYLAADYLRKKGILKSCKLYFLTDAPAIFSVPFFAKELVKVAARYQINVLYQHNLVAVDGGARTATFDIVGGEKQGQKLSLKFDLLHMTPPQSPPAAVKSSPLANAAGFVEVNQNTMQHVRFPNVFSLGDASSTPNSKTAAAVRKQAPVVVRNLLTLIRGGQLDPGYDGYASCPLTTAYGKVLMAEFIYGGKVTPTFPLDPSKERWVNWWIKVTGLPFFYWHYMLKGHEWFFPHNTKFVEPA
ncbi:MAG: NAD(P)/FAD-dependent oxidoreductase [Gammaproteobacteria bacterium]|nr:NAD(P)/FAD-dependent oxidoreductase [Gammaproteobacteria bacterium]